MVKRNVYGQFVDYTCTVYNITHVQCTTLHMYSVSHYTCTVYSNTHVQYTTIHMYSVQQYTCTVYNTTHVQRTTLHMYSVQHYTCTVYNNTHVQCTTLHMYSIQQYTFHCYLRCYLAECIILTWQCGKTLSSWQSGVHEHLSWSHLAQLSSEYCNNSVTHLLIS
jgi:hypothetical protein